MITQQQFLDAVADFEGLILEGLEIDAALAEAAISIGMVPEKFRTRLAKDMTLEERVGKIRREAEGERFRWAAKAEVELCKKMNGPYRGISFIDFEARVLKISEVLEDKLGRPISEDEKWTIGEILDPAIQHLRTFKFKDPEMLRILISRTIEGAAE